MYLPEIGKISRDAPLWIYKISLKSRELFVLTTQIILLLKEAEKVLALDTKVKRFIFQQYQTPIYHILRLISKDYLQFPVFHSI